MCVSVNEQTNHIVPQNYSRTHTSTNTHEHVHVWAFNKALESGMNLMWSTRISWDTYINIVLRSCWTTISRLAVLRVSFSCFSCFSICVQFFIKIFNFQFSFWVLIQLEFWEWFIYSKSKIVFLNRKIPKRSQKNRYTSIWLISNTIKT